MIKFLSAAIALLISCAAYLLQKNTKLKNDNKWKHQIEKGERELQERVTKARIDAKKNRKGKKYRRKDEK